MTESDDDVDYDVIVVGAGGAGLAAAATAAQGGARVLLVEAAAQIGGATALAGGSFMAAGTTVQVDAGHPGDSVEEFYDYYAALNQWEIDPPVVRRFCEHAAPTLDWLIETGIEFTPAGLYRAQLERFPRSHRAVGAGAAIVDALHRACRNAGVDIAVGQRVDELLMSGGRVRGVAAGDEQVTAGAVVLTCGGFGADPDLLAAHLPDLAAAGDWVWSPTASTCVGDGLRLGDAVGAATTGTNHGEILLTPGFGRDLEPFLPGWLVFVNAEGRRFVNEAAPYAALSRMVSAQNGRCWVLLDESMRRTAAGNAASAAFGAGSWSAEYLLTKIEEGRIPTYESVADAAYALGMPPAMLEATVARYSADAAAGRTDTRFGKPAPMMKPFEGGPTYAVEMRAAVVALTGYGLRIDPEAQVLRATDHEPVPGLYAAGEVTGSLLGPMYLGGGNAIGNALVFGRIAAQSALAELKPLVAP